MAKAKAGVKKDQGHQPSKAEQAATKKEALLLPIPFKFQDKCYLAPGTIYLDERVALPDGTQLDLVAWVMNDRPPTLLGCHIVPDWEKGPVNKRVIAKEVPEVEEWGLLNIFVLTLAHKVMGPHPAPKEELEEVAELEAA